MDIVQAIQEPDKKSLVSLEFTVANSYPSEATDKGYKTRVMASTPQGIKAPYITFFTDQPLSLIKGKKYSVKSASGPQGPKGVVTNHWGGKAGFTVYSQANITEQGATPQYTPPAQEGTGVQTVSQNPPYNSQPQTAPVTVDVVPATSNPVEAAPIANTGTLNENQLIAKFGSIYAKARQTLEPRLQEMGDPDPSQKAHEFGLKAITACPEWWFGEKSTK